MRFKKKDFFYFKIALFFFAFLSKNFVEATYAYCVCSDLSLYQIDESSFTTSSITINHYPAAIILTPDRSFGYVSSTNVQALMPCNLSSFTMGSDISLPGSGGTTGMLQNTTGNIIYGISRSGTLWSCDTSTPETPSVSTVTTLQIGRASCRERV